MREQSSGSFLSDIRLETENYVQARINLFQLQLTEKLARLTGVITVIVVVAILFLLLISGLSLMAGFYFAEKLQSNYYGFAVVAGFYAFLSIVCWIARKKLATFFAGKFVKILFETTKPDTAPKN
ncbi:MAG: hypothetical protein MUE71_03875 [Chitinophagaceae bacterium]|jgi:uncharacterized membrane protein YqjE|nr:hypothetical protein [Chitinophagaceae bacterium]